MENPQPPLNPTQVSTPSPTTPETTTPEAVSVAPVPKRKTSKILIGVLVLLFLVAGGVFAYDYFKPKVKEDENLPTPVPQVSAEPVVDEMSGWEKYTDDTYNFSIKYPNEWSSSPNSNSSSDNFVSKTLWTSYSPDNVITEGGDSIEGAVITISIHKEPVTVESYSSGFDVDFGGTPKTEEQLTINSVSGVLLKSNNSVVGNKKSFIFEKNGLLYTIDFNWNPAAEKYADLTDQILSTFEFVETQGNTIGPSLGKVTGKLCYPSEFLPSGEIVAKNVQSGEIYTQNYSGNTENYTFELPVGTYHLRYQAHASANNPSIFTSYYHTLCGENPEYTYCQSTETHSIIPTLVKQGETTTDVNLCGEGTIEDSTF